MATVVVDSTNLADVLADATGESAVVLPVDDNASAQTATAVEPTKPADAVTEADDVEGEDGLTARQKREWTAAMLKTVGKKTRQVREAEEFAAAQYSEKQLAEQRAKDLADENARLKEQLNPKQATPPEGEKPQRDKFETDKAYQDAVDDWRVDQRFKARETEINEQRQAQIVEVAKARIAHALEVVPDYAAVTGAADYIVPSVIAVWMQQSPRFAELGYHFAKNPGELGTLAIMDKTKAEVAFREIEAKLQPFAASKDAKAEDGVKPSTNGTQPSTKTDIVPSRPRPSAPITPLSSASSVQVVKDEATMDVREVITDWSRKNKVNLSRRQRH